jgi:hypothetical protein
VEGKPAPRRLEEEHRWGFSYWPLGVLSLRFSDGSCEVQSLVWIGFLRRPCFPRHVVCTVTMSELLVENLDEPDLIPLTSLTPEERVRRRLERDRILDILEEEERQEQGKRKRSVRFAGEEVDWGDVTPATLGPVKANTLIAKMRMEKQRVMRDVVERLSGSQAGALSEHGDSDDESNPDLISPNSRNADLIGPSLDGEETGSESEESGSVGLEDEFDMDAARHQREIALEYFEKRATIGKDMKQVLASHAREPQNEWNQPVGVTDHRASEQLTLRLLQNVPLEATLASPPPKPLISRFKADRMASTYDNASSPSTSLGSLVSAGSTDIVRGAIRTGKLVENTLVGVDDSASEGEDDALKAALGLLRGENIPDTESGRKPTS